MAVPGSSPVYGLSLISTPMAQKRAPGLCATWRPRAFSFRQPISRRRSRAVSRWSCTTYAGHAPIPIDEDDVPKN